MGILTDCRLFQFRRRSRSDEHRPRRSLAPRRVEGLEGRALLSIVGLSAHASPMLLLPIDPMNQPHAVRVARVRPVTLAGYVNETGNAAPTVTYHVVDQFGRDEPSGTFTTQPVQPGQFFFATRIGLNLTRRPGNHDGRQYTVLITAQDSQSTRTIAIPVTVPPVGFAHGRRHEHSSPPKK